MDFVVILILLLIAIALLLIEIFFIPGISIAGIGGLLFLGGSVYYAYAFVGSTAGHLTIFAALLMMFIAIVIFIRSGTLEKMSLKTAVKGKNEPLKDLDIKAGDTGITESRLAPIGKIRVKGQVVEGKTIDDFIDQNEEVVIVKVQSTNVLVERKTGTNQNV